VVGAAALAGDVCWWSGVVGGGGGGDLCDPEPQPGPDHHSAGQLPGPGELCRLRVWAGRAGGHRPADPDRVCVWGVLGVLGASLLEAEFLSQPSLPGLVGVGLIEEGVKLAALWLLARRLPRYRVRDGVVLGAAVGFGFAALESAGYAFNALFTSDGLSLLNLVETEVLRGVLAPVGHGLWTAIVGGCCLGRRRVVAGCGWVGRWLGCIWWWRGCMGGGMPRSRSRCGWCWC
jgi:hypothetical protein